MSNVAERLKKLQQQLDDRGIRSINFHHDETKLNLPKDERLKSLLDFVEAYLDGRSTPMLKIGDAPPSSYRMTPSEINHIMQDPYGLLLLMNYEDCSYSTNMCMLEPDEIPSWPTARWTTLRERGRSIMVEDLDCWSDEVRIAFGFAPYPGDLV